MPDSFSMLCPIPLCMIPLCLIPVYCYARFQIQISTLCLIPLCHFLLYHFPLFCYDWFRYDRFRYAHFSFLKLYLIPLCHITLCPSPLWQVPRGPRQLSRVGGPKLRRTLAQKVSFGMMLAYMASTWVGQESVYTERNPINPIFYGVLLNTTQDH